MACRSAGCYAGPRIGELLALRWSDVDLLRRSVAIQRKVIEISGAGLVEGATKTKAGRRTVTPPRRVVSELEHHRDRFSSTGLVFTSAEGGQVRANSYAHLFPEHGDALADRLDAFIAASTPTPAAKIIDLRRT